MGSACSCRNAFGREPGAALGRIVARIEPTEEPVSRQALGARHDPLEKIDELLLPASGPEFAGETPAIDGRTTGHAGYGVRQRNRKLVEEAFVWAKSIAGCANVKCAGSPTCYTTYLGNGRGRRRLFI
jgi:hypothetical protein